MVDEVLPGYYLDLDSGAWLTLPWPDDFADLPASLGPQVIVWCESKLVHHLTGQPWRFTRGQKRFIHLWYAVRPDGRWLYRSGVKRGAKGPIAHDTPVPTPSGWTRHGDLVVGSEVYAADGSVTTVVDLRPEVFEPTYRVRFRGGASIVCTGSHRWPVAEFVGGSKRVERVATVNDMLDAGLTYGRAAVVGKTKAANPSVARWRSLITPPIEGGPDVDFPVDPYVFGYWLGDGDKDCPRITCHRDDLPSLLGQMDLLDVEHGDPTVTHGETYRVRFGRGTAAVALRAAGVLNNKHIPMPLLRSSLAQRWGMLQGLVDSDGTVATNGTVEISVKADRLADDIVELCTSLGLMPTRTDSASFLGITRHHDRARVRFTPQPEEIVSRLPRKADRMRKASARSHALPFSRSRTVVAIEPVDTAAARCITVAHESHRYLVGSHMVPTCNTGKDPFAAALSIAELCGPTRFAGWRDGRPVGEPHRLALVQVAANSEAQAQDVLRVANAMVPKATEREFGFDKGIKRTLLSGGSKIEILTSSERSSEGDPATAIFLNESHHMTESNNGKAVAEVARRNVGKSPGGLARLLELTNAHQQGGASVAEDSYEAWQSQVAGRSPRQDILYDSREAPPDTNLYDDESRAAGIAAAYSDAEWTDKDRIGDEILDTRTSVADSIRFYLNGLAAAEDAWVDPQQFDSLARPDIVIGQGEKIAMFLDCSKSSDATGLVACRLSDGHVFVLGVWQRPHGERGKGWLAPRHAVDAAVRQAMNTYSVVWFGVDPSPTRDDETEALYWAPSIDSWHRDFAKKLTLWATPGVNGSSVLFDMRTSTRGGAERNRAFTEAAEMVQQCIDDDSPVEPLTHDGNPALRMHVHNAKRRANQWGFTLGKVNRDSKNLVDLAVCMVGAQLGRRVALNSGKVRKRTSSQKLVVL